MLSVSLEQQLLWELWDPKWGFRICSKKKKSGFRAEDNILKSGFK